MRNPDRAGILHLILAAVAAMTVLVACASTGPATKSLSPSSGSSRTSPDITSSRPAAATPRKTLEPLPGALVSADGKEIISTGVGGGEIASLAFSARETSTAVTLSLAATPATCPCAADAIFEPVTVALIKPLGTRHLIDAATRDTITVMSSTTLAGVGWLPPGYTTKPVDTLAAATTGASGPIGWTRMYTASDPANTNVLTITQYVGHHMADTQLINPSGQPVDVNGNPGRVSHNGGADQGYAFQVSGGQVDWQQGGYTFDVSDDLTRILPGQAVLSQTDVLHVARSLVMPS